jgi:tetratricopeptide (TPR) repeat protein
MLHGSRWGWPRVTPVLMRRAGHWRRRVRGSGWAGAGRAWPGASAEVGHRRLEGASWDSLGYAEHNLGNLAEAAACYQRALSMYREDGARVCEAETLTHLGDTRHAAGELAQAHEAWQQALAILEDLQHPDAGPVRAKLASTDDHISPTPSA